MNSLAYVDPLSLAGKYETNVSCRECGHYYKIIVKESTTIGDLETYICPDCQSNYQVTDDPASTNAFEVYRSTFINIH
jgi:transposase-like protein